MNYFEWAKFLERVNEDASTRNLLNNLDTITLRNDLSYYRRLLFEEFEERKCFYCGKELREGKIHVDHFIPWSFIKDDNIWNLVLACPDCNLKKSDKLTEDIYMENLITRNDILIEKTQSPQTGFTAYKEQKLRYIYYWAKCNGYDEIWIPEKRGQILEKV